MAEKLMILGASVYQVPLIKAANEMGLHTIVSSIPGNYPGFDCAREKYEINTVDRESICRVAEKLNIDGITTTGTDVAVSTIGFVNGRMKLSGISAEAALRTTDKALMKECFRKNGVSAADFEKVFSEEEAEAVAERIGYPVVVKCVDSSGSRGITRVESREGLSAAYENAMRVSRKDYVLVEETLKGREIGVDGIVSGGEIVFIAPHLKYTYPNGGVTITAGHSFPYAADEEVKDEIKHQIQLAVSALGIDNCAFNADVFVDGNRVSIIEVGGRAGATCIPELISSCFGFSYYEAIINSALGRPLNIPEKIGERPCMAKLLMSPVDGIITEIDRDAIDRMNREGVVVKLDFGEGDEVEAMINGTTRIGHLIAFTDRENEFDSLMMQVYEAVKVDGRTLKSLWEM